MTASSSSDDKAAAGKDDTGSSKYNIFRDSGVRYLGYANEVGEAFRYQFPRWVLPSYVVAFGYCVADAATSGWAVYRQPTASSSSSSSSSSSQAGFEAAWVVGDTLLWQSLASVAIPGATIHTIVRASRWTLRQAPRGVVIPLLAAEWIPTVMGLLSIPVIVHPIDHGVDFLLDNTTRKLKWF